MRFLAALVGGLMVGVCLYGCTPTSSNSKSEEPSAAATHPASPSGRSRSASPKPSAVTEPVKAPSSGNVSKTVATARDETKKPVPMDQPGTTGKVTVRVTRLTSIKAKARIPGEVSGPALVVRIKLTNGSDANIEGSAVLVTLYDSSGAPGGEMVGDPAAPLSGTVAPGKSASGDYVFTVPTKRRSPIRINVTLPTDSPVLVFRGDAPIS